MTPNQIADYYEVGIEAIQKCYQRNKEEIDPDGTATKSYKDFLSGQDVQLEHSKGKTTIQISPDVKIIVPNRGVKCFSKRAILRIGMLLRDSKIAQEVRTQLLNTFEHATETQRTQEIINEQDLYIKYAKAAIEGSKEDLLYAAQDVFAYKNRHINELQNRVEILEPKGKYYDTILRSKGSMTITQIAKDYGMSGVVMNNLLKKLKIQYRQNNTYLLYQKYTGKGYTDTATIPYVDNYGTTRVALHTYWTQSGRFFLYEILKENGILPTVEKEQYK